jgi:hypothetical protein
VTEGSRLARRWHSSPPGIHPGGHRHGRPAIEPLLPLLKPRRFRRPGRKPLAHRQAMPRASSPRTSGSDARCPNHSAVLLRSHLSSMLGSRYRGPKQPRPRADRPSPPLPLKASSLPHWDTKKRKTPKNRRTSRLRRLAPPTRLASVPFLPVPQGSHRFRRLLAPCYLPPGEGVTAAQPGRGGRPPT